MDAEQGGATVERRHCGARASRPSSLWRPTGLRAPSRWCSCARARRAPAGRARRARRARAASWTFWSGVLPKPMPGSRQTFCSGTPRRDCEGKPLFEKGGHLGDDVVVPRRSLHRPRLALHVHQAEVRAGVGDDAGQLGVAAQRRDVVHQLGAELERAPRDLGLGGVDRDGHAREAARAPAPRGGAPRPARRPPSRVGSTPRRRRRSRLRRPSIALRRVCRILSRREAPTVGEAVGSDVEDAHHRGPRQTIFERRSSHLTVDRSGMSGTGRVAAVLLTVAVLLGAVVVAAGGETPVGDRGLARALGMAARRAREPAPGADGVRRGALRRPARPASARGVRLEPSGGRKRGRVVVAVMLVVLLVLFVFAVRQVRATTRTASAPASSAARRPRTVSARSTDRYEPQFATVPVLVVLALLAVAAAAWFLARRATPARGRRRRGAPGGAGGGARRQPRRPARRERPATRRDRGVRPPRARARRPTASRDDPPRHRTSTCDGCCPRSSCRAVRSRA